MSKRLTLFIVLLASAFVQAQSVPQRDTVVYFFKPHFTVFFAPLALADYVGGYNFRFGTEYSLGEKVNGLTEVSIYMPWHQTYNNVSGFKVRQDFRKYNMNKMIFMGASIMLKQQNLDYLAVIPITDSTYYKKTYTLHKTIISPSFTIGFNQNISNHLYIDVAAYAGFRVKFAETDGLTPTERSTMWNYDVEYDDLDKKTMLKQGQHVGIELQVSVRVGYVIY